MLVDAAERIWIAPRADLAAGPGSEQFHDAGQPPEALLPAAATVFPVAEPRAKETPPDSTEKKDRQTIPTD
jgi:hypothetical protein